MSYPPPEYVDQCPKCRHIRPRLSGLKVRKIGSGRRFTCFLCDVPTVAVKSVDVPSLWPKDVILPRKDPLVEVI